MWIGQLCKVVWILLRIRFLCPFLHRDRVIYALWMFCRGLLVHLLIWSYCITLVGCRWRRRLVSRLRCRTQSLGEVFDRGIALLWFFSQGFHYYRLNLL